MTATLFPGMARPFDLRDIFLRIPEQALGLIDLYQLLMRSPSPLTPGERELIYAYGSLAAGCHFCFASHSRCAIDLGVPQEVFAIAPAELARAPLRAGLAPLLRYTTALVVDGPVEQPRPESVAVRGMETAMLLDAVLVAGLTAYINRLINGLGAELPDARHAENGERLARFGYLRVREEVARSLRDANLSADGAWPAADRPVPEALRSREDILRMLASYERLVSDRRSPATQPEAASFAARLAAAPVKSTTREIARLFALGWTEREVIDLVIGVATAAFASRVNGGIVECGLRAADRQERAHV